MSSLLETETHGLHLVSLIEFEYRYDSKKSLQRGDAFSQGLVEIATRLSDRRHAAGCGLTHYSKETVRRQIWKLQKSDTLSRVLHVTRLLVTPCTGCFVVYRGSPAITHVDCDGPSRMTGTSTFIIGMPYPVCDIVIKHHGSDSGPKPRVDFSSAKVGEKLQKHGYLEIHNQYAVPCGIVIEHYESDNGPKPLVDFPTKMLTKSWAHQDILYTNNYCLIVTKTN